MGKRQKWKRVHVLLQFTSVVVGCVINEEMVLELHGLESCLNSTRAHEARVQSQYLIPLFHANVSRWIKKNGTRAHQDRVPQKMIDCYIVQKQCFWTKYFQN